MIPSANPYERGVLLPYGCTDLIDVLRLPRLEPVDPVRTFIRQALLRAEVARAFQLIISAPMVNDADCYVTQLVKWERRFDSSISGKLRSEVVEELLRLASVTDGHFPAEGVVCVPLMRRQLKWKLEMETADADCVLMPHDGE